MPILQLESGHFVAVFDVRVRLGLALSFQARDLQFQLNELAEGEARRDRIERGVRRDFTLNVCFPESGRSNRRNIKKMTVR